MGAETDTDTGGEPDAPDLEAVQRGERLAKKDRSVRRRVLLTVAPLIPTLFVPWPDGFSWEMNELFQTAAFVTVPIIALVATVVALIAKVPLLVRSLVLGGLGILYAVAFHGLSTSPGVLRGLDYDVSRLDAYALYMLLGVPIVVISLELYAALDRRSRFRATVAGLGWMILVASYFMPMRADRVDSMAFLVMTEALADVSRHEKNLFIAAPMLLVLLTALFAAALTLLRLIGNAERRERWRPRSGCLAIWVGALLAPLVFGLALLLAFTEEEVAFLGAAYDGSAFVLGFFVGLPALLASGLDGLSTIGLLAIGEGDARNVRRARLGLGAVGAVSLLACLVPVVGLVLPDSREDEGAEVLREVANVVVDTSMGAPLDPEYVGGYSEFDLRASSGALREVVGDAEPTFEYATFQIAVAEVSAAIEVGVDPEGELHYLGGHTLYDHAPRGSLERASEPLADLAARMNEGLTSITCLSQSAPPDLPGFEEASPISGFCSVRGDRGRDRRRRIRDLGRDDSGHDGTGTYHVWVRAGGTVHRLRGTLYSDTGRLWIGRALIGADAE